MYQQYFVIAVLIIVGLVIYDAMNKRTEFNKDAITREKIQKYLSNPKNKRPFMWIHVPYESNTRNWIDFMSRKTHKLNQPYIELCLRSIINHCDESFNICIVDDSSFVDLIPNWNIDMSAIASPTKLYYRQLAMTTLIYLYGGMVVPASFVCLRDLQELYIKGTRDNKMFVCEHANVHSTIGKDNRYISNSNFMGADKENSTVCDLVKYIDSVCINEYTSEPIFINMFDEWCDTRTKHGDANRIYGSSIGVKTKGREQITISDLLNSTNSLNLCPDAYGILIPMHELSKRVQYGWFMRSNEKQILTGNFSLAKYMILSIVPPEHTDYDSNRKCTSSLQNENQCKPIELVSFMHD